MIHCATMFGPKKEIQSTKSNKNLTNCVYCGIIITLSLVGDEKMEEKEKVLSLQEILGVLWRYKVLILVLAIVVGSLQYVRTTLKPDVYAADGLVYVTNLNASAFESEAYISQFDIESARMLSTSYIEILKGRSFLTDISREMDERYTWQQLRGMIKIQLVNETELLSVTAYAPNPVDAYKIVQKFLAKAPEQLMNVFVVGEVKIIDEPIKPTAPQSKGELTNAIVGFMVGAILGVILAFLLKAMDRKIHSVEALAERYEISILGELD